jgi:hypothetical protein
VSTWGALAAGSVVLVLGASLLWLGLEPPSGEPPFMALVRILLEWMLGLIFMLSGIVTPVAVTWTAIRDRHQVSSGIERDLLISVDWPNKTDW